MANSDRAFSLAAAVRQAVGDKPLEIAGQVVQIPREKITPNAANFYAMTDLETLATSIQLTGLIHPIIVRPDENGGYVITDGERRYRATGILFEAGDAKWATIPAIVRTPINAVLEELSLIEANRQSRKLTDAELSKQAERIQELLVALKASGVEIPGRIRTAVHEAMQISESKLARLKKIRSSLAPQFLKIFDEGEMNESAAYELAQAPWDRQALILPTTGQAKKLAAYEIRDRVRYAEKCMTARDCPYGGTCSHGERQFTAKRSAPDSERCGHFDSFFCCQKCHKRMTCSSVCKAAAADVAAEREEDERRAQESKVRAQELADAQKRAADADWARVRKLREAAGLQPDDVRLLCCCSNWKHYESRDLAGYNEGHTVIDALRYSSDLVEVAGLFGVSLDTLAGLDAPAGPGGISWHLTAETPPPTGQTVIFWGSRGLRVPPSAAITNYINAWPEEYTWWATVSPPAAAAAPASDDAADPALAPAT